MSDWGTKVDLDPFKAFVVAVNAEFDSSTPSPARQEELKKEARRLTENAADPYFEVALQAEQLYQRRMRQHVGNQPLSEVDLIAVIDGRFGLTPDEVLENAFADMKLYFPVIERDDGDTNSCLVIAFTGHGNKPTFGSFEIHPESNTVAYHVTPRARNRVNENLVAFLVESGMSDAGLARRVNDLGAQKGLDLRYDKTSVSRWVKGITPRGEVPNLIATAIGNKLGRPVPLHEIGLDPALPSAHTVWEARWRGAREPSPRQSASSTPPSATSAATAPLFTTGPHLQTSTSAATETQRRQRSSASGLSRTRPEKKRSDTSKDPRSVLNCQLIIVDGYEKTGPKESPIKLESHIVRRHSHQFTLDPATQHAFAQIESFGASTTTSELTEIKELLTDEFLYSGLQLDI